MTTEQRIAKELVDVLMGKVKWYLGCERLHVLAEDRAEAKGKAYAYERAAEMIAERFQIGEQ